MMAYNLFCLHWEILLLDYIVQNNGSKLQFMEIVLIKVNHSTNLSNKLSKYTCWEIQWGFLIVTHFVVQVQKPRRRQQFLLEKI